MKLIHSVPRCFHVAKVFRENSDKINCFNFSPNGEIVISSSDDDSIMLYDCQEGKPKRTLYSKTARISSDTLMQQITVVYSSNKRDDTIRYLSLHDNKYIRYFPGHSKRVVALSMSPVDDTFISGSLDKTIWLWDLRSPNCQGLMHLQGKPVCPFDPEGLIFAEGVNSEMWTGLKFSNDGKLILISTHGMMHMFEGYANSKAVTLEAYGIKVAVLDGKYTGPITCLQFNPKFMTFASACSNTAFWLPTIDD
ncbi:hypothetical protein FD754_010413 [Muntiacus muntjak]|uniref:Uncharacterized protein n=1 Tax=Muntiacus muntjak TaxID=9888 RepID=A0A5N3WZF8_MUNMU|nr:hypothetical protein FD754_010413 [Muntiacus muntjak]